MRSISLKLSRKEMEYLKSKTGAEDFNEAIETFVLLMHKENVDAEKFANEYVKKLMEKDGIK